MSFLVTSVASFFHGFILSQTSINDHHEDQEIDGAFLNHFDLILIGSILVLLCIICAGLMFILYFKRKQSNPQQLALETVPTHSESTTLLTSKVLSVSCTELTVRPKSYKSRAHTITTFPDQVRTTRGYHKHVMGIAYKTRRRTYDGPEGDHHNLTEDKDDSGEFTIPTLPKESSDDDLVRPSPSFQPSADPVKRIGRIRPFSSMSTYKTTLDGNDPFSTRKNTHGIMTSDGTIITASYGHRERLDISQVAMRIVAAIRILNTSKDVTKQ